MTRKEYIEKYGLPRVVNDMKEVRHAYDNSIIFPNGWVASIVNNSGVDVYHPSGKRERVFYSNKRYSVTVCDYNGYFDWEKLNKSSAIQGCIYCDTEEEIQAACDIIRKL